MRRIAAALSLLVIAAGSPAKANILGFNNGTLNFQNGSPSVSAGGSSLMLTTDAGGEATSWFYNTPQHTAAFFVDFTYTVTGSPAADGAAFVIQNDPRGANAIGGSGGYLGYSGIGASAGIALNLFFNPGTAFVSGGAPISESIYNQVYPVVLVSGDPIEVTLSYNPGTLTEGLLDRSTGDSFSLSYAVNLGSFLTSPNAFVGFTAGTGQISSFQTISDFSFTELTPVPEPGYGILIVLMAMAAFAIAKAGESRKPGRIARLRRVETGCAIRSTSEYLPAAPAACIRNI